MAEREGFEPSVPVLPAHTISSRAPSAARTSLPLSILIPQRREVAQVVGRRLLIDGDPRIPDGIKFVQIDLCFQGQTAGPFAPALPHRFLDPF